MAEFEKVIGTITVNKNILQVDNQFAGNMFSSDLTYNVNFTDDFWTGFDILEWYAASSVVGETVVCKYDSANEKLKIPYGAYIKNGPLYISMRGIKDSVKYSTNILVLVVGENINIEENDIIQENDWLDKVQAIIDDVFVSKYDPQYEVLVQKVEKQISTNKELLDKTQEQQTQIDNAIDIMGDYEIVQDNPTQIRFKKGDGTYGNTVNLGDNLASKSMVNAGYDTYSGNSYSGSASDYGIEIGKASGNYEQVTTNGYQLFDQSKLSDVTSLGVTLKNNGDGSFTITGSGNTTGLFTWKYDLADEEFSKLCKDPTKVSLNNNGVSNPSFMLVVQKVSDNTIVASVSNGKTVDVSSFLSADYRFRFQFYGANGSTIVAGIVKPMLYCQGDGTWEPFTGGEPSPSPDYAQEPKFFEPKHVNTNGGNLFDASKFPTKTNGGATITNNGDGSLTISGSGNLTNNGTRVKIYTHKETVKLLKVGKLKLKKFDVDVFPRLEIGIYNGVSWVKKITGGLTDKELDITSSDLETTANVLMVRFEGVSGQPIKSGTIKPMLYQDGDGTWYPFNTNSTPLDITLRALPNGVCDTYENRVITRRVGVYIVDTIDLLQTEVTSGRKYTVLEPENKKYQDGMISFLCNKIQKTEADTQDDCIYQNPLNFVIVGTADDTLDTFKEKFLNTIVYYELAEPTTEQVDLPVIPSYFPFTNAWHDSEVEASDLTWNILARQYGSGQTTIKKDEAVLTELDLNTERKANPTTVKVQLQDSEGKVLYLETSSENIYIQSGRFSGKTVQQVLENSIQAISATDEYIEVDVPDSMTQSIDEEFLVDEVDESETEIE